MKLGIIGAMDVEVALLKEKMENTVSATHAGTTYHEGTLEGVRVVLVQCGVGKVNAALCAQIMISVFGVTHIVNTGIAGSLCAELDIGDLVVSKDAMYHDFDCVHFGYEMGRVPGMYVTAFPADATMVEKAFAVADAVHPGHAKIGRVATGDLFVATKPAKEAIIEKTGALCTEMEGAAIAHVAYRNRVPFVIIRAISDKADNSAEMDYPVFEAIAARRCARVTMMMAKSLGESEKE